MMVSLLIMDRVRFIKILSANFLSQFHHLLRTLMNVIAALLAPKIQNALILSVNISANAIQDWIFGILKKLN